MRGPDAAYFARVASVRNARVEIHTRVDLQRAQARRVCVRVRDEMRQGNHSTPSRVG